MKKCPFCAEEIQDAAVVCKHCGRDLVASSAAAVTAPKKKSHPILWTFGILFGLFVLFAIFGTVTDSTPKMLTAEHQAAIEAAHASHAWIKPKSIELRSGIVVVEYEVSGLAIPAKTFGESRLLGIREALLPFGYKSYRVNVNGPSPGTGLVRRIGAARFLGGGSVEWLTP